MRYLRIRDLIDFALSEIKSPEIHIQQLYQWHFERSILAIKFLIGGGGSGIAGLIIATFDKQLQISNIEFSLLLFSVITIFMFGIISYIKLRLIQQEYVSTLALLNDLNSMVPFFKLYRSS